MAKEDYGQLAKEVVAAVGGKENIVNVTNCMTRLRFVLKDDTIPNKDEVSKIKGVKGVMNQGGQYQVIIGTHVSEVVKFVKTEAGITENSKVVNKEDYQVMKKDSLWNRFFKVISGCIMPMIGPMIAGGILKGILVILTTAGVLAKTDGTWGGEYMPIEKPARALTEHQISFDIISLDYLAGAEVKEKQYAINGQNFEVMLVPYSTFLPQQGKELLGRLEQSGVRVIYLEKEIYNFDMQKELGQYQAVKFTNAYPELVVGEYMKNNVYCLMLFNENIGNTIDTEMTISDGNAVYRYDAFANTLTEVSQKSQLILQPYESVVFLQGEENQVKVIAEELEATFTEGFDRGSGKKSFGTDDRMEDRTDLLPKKWKVTFADSCSYPEFIETVPTEKLDLINSITGFENKSGTVRYEGTMQLEKIDTERSIQLELGNTYETAEVFVNGHSEGVRICKPYRFHLTGLLREGENQLAVEVTNTLGTQMRDAISHYLPIEPFGVEGMVHLYMGK